MVIIRRKLMGIIPYQTVFFPDKEALLRVVSSLKRAEMARIFCAAASPDHVRHLVRREFSYTVLNDLRRSQDELMKGFSATTRYQIGLARKLGERVRIERNADGAFEVFLRVFNDFARAKSGVWPMSQEILNRYGNHSDVVIAWLDQEPSVVTLMLRDSQAARVRMLNTASRRLQVEDKATYRNLGYVNRLMHWENMCFYKAAGFDTYDWGGIPEDSDDDGVAKFKMSFGGEIVRENAYLAAGSPMLGKLIVGVFDKFTARGRYGRNQLSARNDKRKAAALSNT